MKKKEICAAMLAALLTLTGLSGCKTEKDARPVGSETVSQRGYSVSSMEEDEPALLTFEQKGRGSDTAGGDYRPETDVPYQMYATGLIYPLTDAGQGYYFLSGVGQDWESSLYYWPKGGAKAAPVCGKPGCLHNKKEIDPESMTQEEYSNKMSECEAYMGRTYWIQYLNGKLYGLERDSISRDLFLTEIDPAGGARKRLRTLEEGDEDGNTTIYPLYSCFHRGYLYFYRFGGEQSEICRLDLTQPDSQPEVIYEPEDIFPEGFMLYDRYLYAYSRDHFEDESPRRYVRVDVETKEQIAFEAAGAVAIFEGKLAIPREDGMYLAGLDGSEPQLIFRGGKGCYTGGGYLVVESAEEDSCARYPFFLLDGSGEVQGSVSLRAVGRPDYLGADDDHLFFYFRAQGNDDNAQYALNLSTGELVEYYKWSGTEDSTE